MNGDLSHHVMDALPPKRIRCTIFAICWHFGGCLSEILKVEELLLFR
jgi:hypothetical protein